MILEKSCFCIFFYQYHKAPVGSQHKLQAQKQLFDEISYRKHVDYSISQIGKLLFADSDSSMVLESVRPIGQPLVDDWDCLKMIVSRSYFCSGFEALHKLM